LAPPAIVPVNRPNVQDVVEDEEESIVIALENRPEIHVAQDEIETAQLERERLANALLPQVNVTGSIYQGGRGHYPRDVFRGVDDFFDSVASIPSGVDDRDNFSYSVGVQASVPLGNRAARGAFHRAQSALAQAKQNLQKVKLEAVARVRLALRSVRTSHVLVLSKRQARALQEANVAAEEKRLQLGFTTSYRVLEVEEDLTLAQTQEVQALINYEKATVDLRLAEGDFLAGLGIAFEPPASQTPVSFLRSVRPPELE